MALPHTRVLSDDAPTGHYEIFEKGTTMVLIRQVDTNLVVIQKDVDELMKYMLSLPLLPNPRRPSTFLKRPQITYASVEYNFGQKTRTMPMDENVPEIVLYGMNMCNEFLASLGHKAELNGAHVSMYPDGTTGVDPHADDERVIDQSVPIVSLSFGIGRRFSIYRPQTKEERETQLSKSKAKIRPSPKPVRISSVILEHGDICIMINMQHNLFHGIDKDSKITRPRLNITYRKFK